MPGSRKKIITLGSSITLILIFLHLIGVYIYSGGHYEGVRGGSISIGIVDNVPNAMNPFQYGINHNSDLLYRFLFRGLIKYNISTGIYQGDLTSCDISNLSKVACTMRDDAVWSDGTRVKSEDIIATIEEFKNSAPQEEMKGFLSSVKAIKTTDGIEIQSTQKSQHMIELLSYPIVKSDVITLINSGAINEKNYITSGPYILGESALDKEYGFNRITLLRNEKYSQSTWLDKIHFKFFKDLSSLERSAETLTMVIPPAKNEKIDIGPRFKEYLYTNYEYFSVFLNTNTLNRILRNSIHWQIGTSFSGNIAEDHKRTDTIFPSGGALLPTGAMKAFPDILRDLGYTKKTEILAKAEQISTLVSGELVIPPVKYWTNKSNASILFVEELPEEIIFTGKVPANTETVTINDYTLREFIPGNTIFAYKVSQLMGSLKEGKNTYNLSLKLSNGKTETETLTVYASSNSGSIAEYKKQLQDEYSATQNTPALIAARERTKQEKINQIRELQDEYYFNNKNEIFVIKIGYIVGPQSTEVYAKRIDEALKLLGIKTELIAYTAKDIQNIISTGEKKYDILVIGISVEGSLASIGKLFSNTDAKNSKLNFSNIESKTLENQFTELRATTNVDKISQIEESISKIMNTESFFVPISSPYHRIWVDRNVKGIPKIEVIPDIAAFVDVFVGTSIKENYIRNAKDKNISGFFKWIVSQL